MYDAIRWSPNRLVWVHMVFRRLLAFPKTLKAFQTNKRQLTKNQTQLKALTLPFCVANHYCIQPENLVSEYYVVIRKPRVSPPGKSICLGFAEYCHSSPNLSSWSVFYPSMLILVGCAQTAAVGDPMEVVGLLFFLCPNVCQVSDPRLTPNSKAFRIRTESS